MQMQYSLFQLLRVSDNSWQLILYQSVQVGWRDSTMMHVVIHISASVRLITSRYLWVFWPTCSRTLPPRKNGRVPSLPFFLGRRVLGARGVMRRVEFRLGTGYETPVQPRRTFGVSAWLYLVLESFFCLSPTEGKGHHGGQALIHTTTRFHCYTAWKPTESFGLWTPTLRYSLSKHDR